MADAEKANTHIQSFQVTVAATLPGLEQFCRRTGKARCSLIVSSPRLNPGREAGGALGHVQEI